MILTAVFNPNLIRKTYVQTLDEGIENRVISEKLYIGDCGIYSALIIKILQGEPFVTGFSAGVGGRYIKNFLDKNRIRSDLLIMNKDTKITSYIRNKSNSSVIKLVSTDTEIDLKDWKNIKHKIHNHNRDTDVVLLTGKIPGANDIASSKSDIVNASQKVVVEFYEENLNFIKKYRPYVLVASLENMSYFNVVDTIDDVALEDIRVWIVKNRIKYFFINCDDKIYYISKNKIAYAKYSRQKTIYPIEMSALIGGITIGIRRKYLPEHILRLAATIANEIVIENFPQVITRSDIDRKYNSTKIVEVYNGRNGYIR